MAFADGLARDRFARAPIKNIIGTTEFTIEPPFAHLMSIGNDAAMELVYILEAMMLEIRAGFFAADAARAIQQNFFIFFIFEPLGDQG